MFSLIFAIGCKLQDMKSVYLQFVYNSQWYIRPDSARFIMILSSVASSVTWLCVPLCSGAVTQVTDDSTGLRITMNWGVYVNFGLTQAVNEIGIILSSYSTLKWVAVSIHKHCKNALNYLAEMLTLPIIHYCILSVFKLKYFPVQTCFGLRPTWFSSLRDERHNKNCNFLIYIKWMSKYNFIKPSWVSFHFWMPLKERLFQQSTVVVACVLVIEDAAGFRQNRFDVQHTRSGSWDEMSGERGDQKFDERVFERVGNMETEISWWEEDERMAWEMVIRMMKELFRQ